MEIEYYVGGVNRTVCSVLEEMRKLNETRNYSSLLGLIEEAQFMVNRMEAALHDAKDIRRLTEKRSELKKEVEELKCERNQLKPKEDDSSKK
jgi:seryl-tRNA synthetase